MKRMIMMTLAAGMLALGAGCGGEDGTAGSSSNQDANTEPNNGACTPSAEVCDGEDNDCDGEIDNAAVDAETFYRDADSDGFGDMTDTVEGCATPDGYVKMSGDCNDDDAAIRPGADELCDNIDNNCDGNIDETFTDLATACTAGLGVCESSGEVVCNSAGDGTECDAVPGEPTEMPESTCDGVDADCDGVVDNGCDDDNDGWCDEDFTVTTDTALCAAGTQIGDCNDDDALVHPGVTVGRCDGVDDDCDGDVDEIDEAQRSFANAEYAFPEGFTFEIASTNATGYIDETEKLSGIHAAPMEDGSWCIGATDRTSQHTYLVHFDPNTADGVSEFRRSPGLFHVRGVAAIGNYCGALVGSRFAKRVMVMDVTTGIVNDIIPNSGGVDSGVVTRDGFDAVMLDGVETFVWTMPLAGDLVYETVPANGSDADVSAPVVISTDLDPDGFSTSSVVGTSLWVIASELNQFNNIEMRAYEVDLTTGTVSARGALSGTRDGYVGGFASDGTDLWAFRYHLNDGTQSGRISLQSFVDPTWSATIGPRYGVPFGPLNHLTANTWQLEPLAPAPGTTFWVLDAFRDHLRVVTNGAFDETYAHSALDFVDNGVARRHDLVAAQNIDGDIIQMLYVREDELLPGATDTTGVVGLAEYSCF
jgi:hypothetical protein